ncbi:S41 family peptidase [Micromonospora andamanensis]|uniref:S41 family peptidase n=1 Tax=Micromonospora andamanensis TaxID=1287068 RepID=UPI0019522273|nr:S41 family peptidase [Micromonospora andamanensis]GIJ41161.1 interphotoreceptor retinoid-binding protein [Micromonospora andamanensis]
MARHLTAIACDLLTGKYVFPDRAVAAADEIRRRALAGEYDGLDEAALGHRLTEHLFGLCADKHLRVRLREAVPTGRTGEGDPTVAWREYQRLTGYRIARAERLDGNVGYLDLRGVPDPALGGRAIAAAMELVSHTDALIIDLRRNRGGAPEGVAFWCSYFFPDADTHLNDVFAAATGQTRQYWTLAYLPGARYLDRPVYVLTSDHTFSAGEELAYNLQAQRRATLIGRTTRGGAHPTEAFPITDTLEITIPTARSINPVTGTNWEGTGVTPDMDVPAEQAFAVAYETALQHVLTTSRTAFVLDEAREALTGITRQEARTTDIPRISRL